MDYKSDYPKKTFEHAVAAVDSVVFSVIDGKINILLLELQEKPFEGSWALPGGLVYKDEDLDRSAQRHLLEKTNVKDLYLEQLYSFGAPDRDPNGWVVSVAYLGCTLPEKLKLKTTDRYKSIKWFEVNNLPKMAYDHNKIIDVALLRLKSKFEYTNISQFLLPQEFSLTQLQNLYELVIGKALDKRNFRKKILNLKIIKSTQSKQSEGHRRPAQLYKFTDQKLQEVSIL